MNTTFTSSLRTVLVALTLTASLATSALARTSATPGPAASTVATCSWDRPGHDPFMGDVVAAVDRYQDIPANIRDRLKARMVRREYDDVVSIRRDSITGRARVRYGSAIRDMHFGNLKVCRSVSRAAWNTQMQERGLVYCDSGQCILVPTVCRNVSRIARAEVAHERADGEAPDPGALPVAVLDPELVPIPLDGSPTLLVLDAVPGFESPLDGPPFGGGQSGEAGGHASFAAGSGGGLVIATIAAISGQDSGSEHPSQTPSDAEVAVSIAPVPEPETWGLMLSGIVALAAWRRRRA